MHPNEGKRGEEGEEPKGIKGLKILRSPPDMKEGHEY
jgi:hypothetical protein